MAYTPTTWSCGDTITAEKMNKIEAELQTLSESSGGGTDTDYLTLNWQYGDTYDYEYVDGEGTFCGYKYYVTITLVVDIETDARGIAVAEIASSPEDPNRLPHELDDVVRLLVINRLWGLFGDHVSGESVDYVNWEFPIAESTYNALEEFDETFTISL